MPVNLDEPCLELSTPGCSTVSREGNKVRVYAKEVLKKGALADWIVCLSLLRSTCVRMGKKSSPNRACFFSLYELRSGGLHVIDATNASRTLLMDLESRTWSPDICQRIGIPLNVLPRIVPSAAKYGRLECTSLKGVVLSGCIGDQQSATLGQRCKIGQAKSTMGTGESAEERRASSRACASSSFSFFFWLDRIADQWVSKV